MDDSLGNDEVDEKLVAIAEEFTARLRAGEQPSIEEYAKLYAGPSPKIRDALEGILLLEKAGERPIAGQIRSKPLMPRRMPETIGDFRLVREVGRGGMGIVFEAVQLSLGRRVALKLLPHYLLKTPTIEQRFLLEARIAAQLHHSNIVPVFVVGVHEGCPYYAMQLIVGQSLDRIIRRLRERISLPRDLGAEASFPDHDLDQVIDSIWKSVLRIPDRLENATEGGSSSQLEEGVFHAEPLDIGSLPPMVQRRYWEFVANLGAQAAAALGYAHSQGVLHRDIKPSNLLLDLHETVWISDFGLAKLTIDDGLTGSGDLIGTLRYMAPEALQGMASIQSDLYSLGLTLYEFCVFRPARSETDRAALVDQVSRGRVPLLGAIASSVPVDLQIIIHKCLEFEQAHRYANGQELAADLRRFIRDEPIYARPISWPQRAWRWSRRNRALASALFSVAVLLIVLSVGSTAVAFKLKGLVTSTQAAKQLADAETIKANLARAGALAARDEALGTAYSADMVSGAIQSLDSPRSASVTRLVQRWRWQKASEDLRGWEWHALNSGLSEESHLLFAHPTDVRSVAFQPQGKILASCGLADGVRLWNAETGRELLHLPLSAATTIRWSDDGTLLAVLGHEGKVLLLSLSDGSWREHTISVHPASLGWSPDNRWLAISFEEGTVQVFSLPEMEKVAETTKQGLVKFLRWSPDSKFIAASSGSSLKIWDQRLQLHGTLAGHRGDVFGLKWINASQLCSASRDGTIVEWELSTMSQRNSIPCEAAKHGVGIAWNPSHDQLAILKEDRLSICRATDGTTLHQLRTFSRCFQGFQEIVSWSADGRFLSVATSGHGPPVPLWDVPRLFFARECRQVVSESPKGSNTPVCWSPNGASVASFEGGIAIRNSVTGELSKYLAMPEAKSVLGLQFSPDGKRLAASDGRLWIWDLESGDLINPQRSDGGPYGRLCWSPDSRLLGIQGAENRLCVLNQETGELTTRNIRCNVRTSLDWHHETCLTYGRSEQIAMLDVDSGEQEALAKSNLYHDNTMRWDRQGQRLAFSMARGQLCIVDRRSGARRVFEGHSDLVTSIDWNFDGTRLASLDQKGTIRIWDTTTGLCVYLLPGYASGIAWAPQDPKLAVVPLAGRLQVIDASPSYFQECPPELGERLLNGDQSVYRLAIQAARSQNWKLAADYLQGQSVKPLGWWVRSKEESPTTFAAAEENGWPFGNLQWYAPYQFSNGSLHCVDSEDEYFCPVYSDANSACAIVFGNLAKVAAIAWNGKPLTPAKDSFPWRNRLQLASRTGWNLLQVKLKPPENDASPPVVDLLLTQDPRDLQFAELQSLYLPDNRSPSAGQGKQDANPLPEMVLRNLTGF